MKRFVLLTAAFALLTSFISLLPAPDSTLHANLTGAWYRTHEGYEEVVIAQDGYIVHTVYNKGDKKFLYTVGGPYKLTRNGSIDVQVEFHSGDSTVVGEAVNISTGISGNTLTTSIEGDGAATWTRLDAGGTPLSGVWQITGRMREGKLERSSPTGPRKTLKILTGGRFQWMAINPAVKGFYGTGGGTYTFENGTYTENLEFFSRDNSRVGASLQFNGKLENGEWHHSGNSSAGQPIYEVWSRVR